MGGFAAATAVRRVAEGRYAVELDGDFGIEQAINGGYSLAVMTRALLEDSPHPHPIATSASFLRVAKAGPAEVRVEPLKAGRTAAVARVTLVQNDQALVEALITTGTLDGDAAPVYSIEQEKLPPIEECLEFAPNNGFARQVDVRYDPATMGWLDGRPAGVPEMRGYLRLREPYEPDGILLALAVDALPPVVLNAGASGWAPTVELTWHMRAVPAPGRLAVHGRARLVSDGWFDEEIEVWDSAGRLVAQSRQIARVGRGR
ncbi:thioesterase family protein [Actinoallomurus spadix]|uniref:Thioesterase family protein n=1 Tax=Actinoallomurus spadix TaxID=79912 RepID=A0ABP3FGI5_9ACTN|nr:thioesterase family protein [Actinoallomurus spadix]MCO5989982.1 thioesterase family protein [Actinoallomurus spadix]